MIVYAEAEEMDDEFMNYRFANGKRVPRGTKIGCEIYNPRTKSYELFLLSDIKFSND